MTPRTSPPYRADHVGSLLRPAELTRARDEHAAGRLSADELRAVEDDAIRDVVRKQEDVGLQSATDGEFRRATWHMDFIDALGGITHAEEKITVQFHNEEGTIEWEPAAMRVSSRVTLKEPIFADHFAFLQSCVTTATPKLTIPSPSMVHYRGGRARSTTPSTRSSTTSGPTSPRPTPTRFARWARWAAPTCSSTTPASPTSTIPHSATSSCRWAEIPSTCTRTTSATSTRLWPAGRCGTRPARSRTEGKDAFTLDESGGVAVRGPIERGPVRLAELYAIASAVAERPIKACVGAGPLQLSTMAHFESGPVRNRFDLSAALAGVFRAEIEDLVAAGCRHVQLEDLGAWVPNVTGADRDFEWVTSTVDRLFSGVEGVERCWHFCLGNAWGSRAEGLTRGGYGNVLPRYLDVDVDAFVLDFACRDMADVGVLADLPTDKRVHAGVIDVRNLEVEQPDQVAERIRAVLAVLGAERVTLTTDCGMKQLPRTVARAKLHSLTAGAAIVRGELTGERASGGREPGRGQNVP